MAATREETQIQAKISLEQSLSSSKVTVTDDRGAIKIKLEITVEHIKSLREDGINIMDLIPQLRQYHNTDLNTSIKQKILSLEGNVENTDFNLRFQERTVHLDIIIRDSAVKNYARQNNTDVPAWGCPRYQRKIALLILSQKKKLERTNINDLLSTDNQVHYMGGYAVCNEVKLNGADLKKCDFSEAFFERAEFIKAKLKKTRLIDTRINGANITGARGLKPSQIALANFNDLIVGGKNIKKVEQAKKLKPKIKEKSLLKKQKQIIDDQIRLRNHIQDHVKNKNVDKCVELFNSLTFAEREEFMKRIENTSAQVPNLRI